MSSAPTSPVHRLVLRSWSHPGHIDAEVAAFDSTVDSRPRELAYFIGRDFPADLADAGMTLARFTAICR